MRLLCEVAVMMDSCQTVSEPDAVGKKSGGKRCEQSLPEVGGVLENGDTSPVVSAGAPQGGRWSPCDLLSGLPHSPQASAVCSSRTTVNTLRQLVKMLPTCRYSCCWGPVSSELVSTSTAPMPPEGAGLNDSFWQFSRNLFKKIFIRNRSDAHN